VTLAPRRAAALGPSSLLDLAQLVYDGGNHAPHPTGPRRLAWEIRKRTSVEARLEPSEVRLRDRRLFRHPFLYMAGDRAFPPWSDEDVARLERFLALGGFLLVDDAEETPDGGPGGFDRSVRRELGRVFPDDALASIPASHVLYRSFYIVQRPYGRREGPSDLLGIERDGRLHVVYSRHDLGGAWARDNFGNWERPVEPGGERQREAAFRLGVNVALYALCLSYKDDPVHLPFLPR
jgi:hypothetical protein